MTLQALACSQQSSTAFAMFLMMITPFQQLTIFKDPPPSSFSLCVHYDQHSSKKTGASIHGKSCCNLLQRLMGVDCARGLWLVAGFNESHDSRVRKEQHFRKKKAFLWQCQWPCDLNFHEESFLRKFEYHFTRRETIEFLDSTDTGNDGKNSICLLWNSLNGFQTAAAAELFMRLDDDGHPNILVVFRGHNLLWAAPFLSPAERLSPMIIGVKRESSLVPRKWANYACSRQWWWWWF